MYIHCYAHCLNLALVDTAKHVQEAVEFFFVIIQNLYVFLSSAKAHTIFFQKQDEVYPGKPTRQLQHLSDTRWACKYFAVEVVYSTYGAILAMLQAIIDGNDCAKVIEAEGILLQIIFKFLVILSLFWHIFSSTKSLSDHLQGTQTNLVKPLETLQLFKEWDNHYKYITKAASFFGIDVAHRRPCCNRQVPRRLQDGILLESRGTERLQPPAVNLRLLCILEIHKMVQ